MRFPAVTFSAVVLLGGGLAAQDFIGFSNNGQISFTSRGFLGFGATAGEVMTRIDGSDYAGWGTDTPGFRTVRSVFFVVQDQDAVTTPEVFDIKLYPEDVANPGFPDLAAGVVFATGVTGPAAPVPPGVISAQGKIVTPILPVAVPIQGGGDVFVSWVLPASPTASTADGLSIQALDGNAASASAVKDIPGPRKFPQTAGPATSHGVTRVLPSTLTYSIARQWHLDVAHNGDGGAVMTITNQTTLLGSNNPPPVGFGPAPGTASFMSGTSPDVNGFNVGRADDLTFDYFRTGLANGSFVWLLLDNSFGAGFGPEIPVASLGGAPPGSSGSTCLVDYSNVAFFPFATTTTTGGEGFLVTLIPPFIRPILAGLTLKWQAVGIDTAFHASPCGAQRF